MNEPNDTSLSNSTKTEDPKAASNEKNAPNETADHERANPAEHDVIDPDDEAVIIEAPDPGFVAPAD